MISATDFTTQSKRPRNGLEPNEMLALQLSPRIPLMTPKGPGRGAVMAGLWAGSRRLVDRYHHGVQ